MGYGSQGGSIAKANAFNNDMIGVRTMQTGMGGTQIGDVGPGIIYQQPNAHIGPSSMGQTSKLDISMPTGGLNLLQLQAAQS